MKRAFLIVLLLCAAITMVAANGQTEPVTQPQKTIEIKLAHENAVDQPIGRYSDEFTKKVKEESKGRINITVYPAGQLGNMVDLMTNVSLGLQDMCVIDIGNLVDYMPAYSMPSLPMMITSWDQAEKVFGSPKIAQMNEQLAQEHNLRIMDWWWNGFRNMCTSKEIRKISDFKGVKFRSPGVDFYLNMFNLLGAKPTVVPWGETFSAFQTGIVDGMETTTEAIYTQSFYTLGKYILMTRHIFSCNAPVISEKLWRSLSKEDQELMQRCMDEVTAELRSEVISKESDYIDKLHKTGNTIIELEDKDQLVDLFKPYWNEYATKNNCQDFLDFIISCKK